MQSTIPIPETRPEAIRLGARFYAGMQCQVHKGAARYVANSRCVECCKIERRAGQVANRERDAERKRAKRRALAAMVCDSPAAALALAVLQK